MSLQVFVGIDVFTADNFRSIGDYIFRQPDFTGNLYGK